jgi:hypothetical protein
MAGTRMAWPETCTKLSQGLWSSYCTNAVPVMPSTPSRPTSMGRAPPNVPTTDTMPLRGK